MSVLLFVIGAIAMMAGVAMVGYGIPINEFSFGNTLIIAGTTATVGGLIVIALGATVLQLKRIVETLGDRAATQADRPRDLFEPAVVARPERSRIPFPSRPKAETGIREPAAPMALAESMIPAEVAAPAPLVAAEQAAVAAAPTLQNPDVPVAVVETYEAAEEFSLSPQQPGVPSAPDDLAEPSPPLSVNGSGFAAHTPEPELDSVAQASPAPSEFEPKSKTSYFDTMWPAEPKPARRPISDEVTPTPEPAAAATAETQAKGEPPAILKSGVVDGMGYTLYVDGSIEAELPQGTLHFASINDLRNHLAKTS